MKRYFLFILCCCSLFAEEVVVNDFVQVDYLNGEIYRIKKHFFDGDHLISEVLEDAHETPLFAHTYRYENGICIEETIWGALTGVEVPPLIIDANGMPIKNGIENYTREYIEQPSKVPFPKELREDGEYDELGRLIESGSYKFTYDIADRVVQIEGADGKKTEIQYNVYGQPILVKGTSGISKTFRYGEDGTPVLSYLQEIQKSISDSYWSFFNSHLRSLFPIDAIQKFCEYLETSFSRGVLHYCGYYVWDSTVGMCGNGELNPRYRVSYVNGIMYPWDEMIKTAEMISEAHGGNNVHFCYLGSRGVTKDVMTSHLYKTCIVLGYIPPEAYDIAAMWKKLLADMNHDGYIFHYAHSLGGTVTERAARLMEKHELKRIRVITFGSATILDQGDFYSVNNYISRFDLIPGFDPGNYVYSLIFNVPCVKFISWMGGYPPIDHSFESYFQYFRTHIWHDVENVLEDVI